MSSKKTPSDLCRGRISGMKNKTMKLKKLTHIFLSNVLKKISLYWVSTNFPTISKFLCECQLQLFSRHFGLYHNMNYFSTARMLCLKKVHFTLVAAENLLVGFITESRATTNFETLMQCLQ